MRPGPGLAWTPDGHFLGVSRLVWADFSSGIHMVVSYQLAFCFECHRTIDVGRYTCNVFLDGADIRGGQSGQFWPILTTIPVPLRLLKRFRICSESERLERFEAESSLLQKRLGRSFCLRFCFCFSFRFCSTHS
ncbi:hypothetical protein BD309DRAFT_975819 [Dichomitus squalens]|nr:hypothetical protein BD309DRAFT_975819 [Dichomitus squalens]